MIKSKCEKINQTPDHLDMGMMMIKYLQRIFWVAHNPRLLKEPIRGLSEPTLCVSMLFTKGEKGVEGWWPLWHLFQIFKIGDMTFLVYHQWNPLIYKHPSWKFEGYISLLIFYILPINYISYMDQNLIFRSNWV